MAVRGIDRDAELPDRYRVAVAVSDPAHVEQLVRTARDLAREHDGEVLVVSVVVKPRESPFAFFSEDAIRREFSGDRQELLDRAVALADDVPVRGRLLISPGLAGALRRAARTFDCDALVVGWEARHPHRSVALGRNLDRLVRRAPCDVLVERIGPTADGVEAVLLPAAEGTNTELAAEVARAIARANDARVDVVRMVAPDAGDAERADAEALVERLAADLEGVAVEPRVEPAGDVADALVDAAATRDVTVMGATERGLLQRLVVGPTPVEVGRRAESTVVVARRARQPWRAWPWVPWPWP